MNYASVVRVLALTMIVIAACSLLPAAFAAINGEPQQVFAFLTMGIAIAVIASTTLLLTPKPTHRARPSDGLAVIILFWVFAPVASALPFLIGVANTSPLAAIHEAMSCLTTTGHTVIQIDTEQWPYSLLIWRDLLHIIGALATIVAAISVFAALNLGGPGIHRTILFTIPESSFFDAAPRVVRNVVLLIAGSLLFLTVMQILFGVPVPRAIGDSISVITTGIVYPGGELRAPFSVASAIILSFGLVVGALGMAFLLPVRSGKILGVFNDPENIIFSVLIIVFGATAMIAGLNILDAFGWSLSTLATSGIPLTTASVGSDIPLSLLVVPALIGGSALSAAGGVKLARFIILWRRAWQEFRQLGYRGSIVTFRFRNRELNERSIIGVWVYLISYIVAVFACVAGFSFLGVEFDGAVRMAIGGITNSGAIISDADLAFAPGQSGLLILAMLLGRLEILAILPALSPNFWRK